MDGVTRVNLIGLKQNEADKSRKHLEVVETNPCGLARLRAQANPTLVLARIHPHDDLMHRLRHNVRAFEVDPLWEVHVLVLNKHTGKCPPRNRLEQLTASFFTSKLCRVAEQTII